MCVIRRIWCSFLSDAVCVPVGQNEDNTVPESCDKQAHNLNSVVLRCSTNFLDILHFQLLKQMVCFCLFRIELLPAESKTWIGIY